MKMPNIVWLNSRYIPYLSVLFLFVFIILFANYFSIKSKIKLISSRINLKDRFIHYSNFRFISKLLLKLLALLFILLAILRPQWGKNKIHVNQDARDLVIALDISRSMLAEDISPNRLEFAKLKIRKLVEKFPFDRFGLILFSGTAFLQCPLTRDKAAFLMFLDHVSVETISSGTTSIGNALSLATSLFSKDKNRKNKLLLLITDGEDFSINLNEIEDKALKEHLKIFTYGIGTEKGAPIPIFNRYGKIIGHEKDDEGNIVFSKLNANFLRDISTKLNGYYIDFSYDNSDINKIVKIISSFDREKLDSKDIVRYEDRFHYFLSISFILLLLEWLI